MTNEELLKVCNEKLRSIAPDVTAEDRKTAANTLGINPMTIHRYLNGKAKKLDVGVRIYELISSRIDARKTALTA